MHCVFVYPGQGGQKPGMGDVVLEAFPDIAAQVFTQAEQATGVDLRAVAGASSSEFLLEPAGSYGSYSPHDVQAAIYTISLITHLGLLESGWHPDMAAGYGLGEYSALAAAGVLSFTDGLHLVRQHAKVLEATPPGHSASTRKGRIATERAHELVGALDRATFRDPHLPLVASATASPVRTAEAARAGLKGLIKGPARWQETVPHLVGRGRDVVVEVGPGRQLSGWIAQAHPQVVTRSTGDVRRIRRLTRQPVEL